MNKFSRNNSNTVRNEKSLLEIIHIVYKRKWIIVFCVFIALLIAIIQSLRSTPVYGSTVILKKETAPNDGANSDFMEIVKMQTEDQVETEIELIKTIDVLSSVTKKLKLYLQFDKFIDPNGKTIVLENLAHVYSNPKISNTVLPFQLPDFISVELRDYDNSAKYYIKRGNQKELELYLAETDELLQSKEIIYPSLFSSSDSTNLFLDKQLDSTYSSKSYGVTFDTPLALIIFSYPELIPEGSKFYFTINSFNYVLDWVNASISVEKTGKTSLFSVSAFSTSAYMAKEIANAVVNKYRDSRMEQKKQTIRYSFDFVDEQLKDMQLKLRESEENLSNFKANSQITTISESSTEIVKFLSNLEAEKMNTTLKLNEYKSKLGDMEEQMQSSGYFDQNFLTNEGSGSGGDPFASLLGQIAQLELQRLELLQKRTENHPDVISLDRQINLAKNKLTSYNQTTLTAYQILINTLEKKIADIDNIMLKYDVKLGRLPSQENTFARLLREKSVYEKMFTMLLDKREEMRMAELSRLQDIVIIDPAIEPIKPMGPRRIISFLIAIVLGSFVGLVGVFLIELKNSTLVNLDEIEHEFQFQILSIIPKYTRSLKSKIDNAKDAKEKLISLVDEQSGFKETYNLLRTKLELQLLNKRKIFMVTSCEENSGKSTIVSNLAISFAQNAKRILVIDCDLRKAGLSRIFQLENEKDGLIDYLSDGTIPKLYTRVSKFVDILPTGGFTLDSSNLLNSERMKDLFDVIDISAYDFVIIDTPPITKVVDTLILGKYYRDVVLVLRPDLSLKDNVKAGIIDLSEARIKVRGMIVNAAEISKSYYYKNRYGYGYGYGYGHSSGENGKASMGLKKKVFNIVGKS